MGAHGAGADAEALLGWGEALRVETHGADRMPELSRALAAFVAEGELPPSTIAFVTAAFADDSAAPSVLIDGISDKGQVMFSATGFVATPRQAAATRSALLFEILRKLRELNIRMV